MHPLRTKFKKEIIAEFLPPLTRKSPKRNKVIILCDGLPAVPSKGKLLEFFARKGFWVFHPRYRGTWESGGKFLKKPPQEDIKDVVAGLSGEITSIWDGAKFRIKPDKIFILGSSFGGATAIMSLLDKKISGAVVFSPVVDWRAKSRTEPFESLEKFVNNAFGQAYRYSVKDWYSLREKPNFSPVLNSDKLVGKKLMIFHAKDDDVVLWPSVKKFFEKTGAKLYLTKKGGHMSLSTAMKPGVYKKIRKFLK
jgi:pimeloyl-ACP methyl ester carboxylesterase